MPGAPVGVALLGEGAGECVVRGAPVIRRRVVIDGRSQQRIGELDRAVADRHDPGLLGGGQARRVGTDRGERVADRRHRRSVARGRDEQGAPRLLRESDDAALVDPPDARRRRQGSYDRLAARALARPETLG